MPKLVTGNIVSGNDFYDREKTIEQIWSHLETDSLIFSAPRRFGKSSVAQQLINDPRYGFTAVMTDAEGSKDPSEFLKNLIGDIWKNEEIKKYISKKTKGMHHLENTIDWAADRFTINNIELLRRDWKIIGEEIINILSVFPKRMLIVIDEFSIFIENLAQNKEEANNFLNWFRGLRLSSQIRKNIRFMITGSISILPRVQRLDLSYTLNDLYTIELPPFEPEVAIRFIKELCDSNQIPLDPQLHNKVLEHIGEPVSYFIQAFLTILKDLGKAPISELDLENFYWDKFLSPNFDLTFKHFEERFQYIEKWEADIARSILTFMAKANEPVSRGQMEAIYLEKQGSLEGFSELLDLLLHDRYFVEDPSGSGKYRFYLKAFRDWWERRRA